MKDFEFYKVIRLSTISSKLQKVFSKLNNIYNAIPETRGCLDNIGSEGGCRAWCCKIQTPQLLYSEFLFLWSFISKNWVDDEICDLFEKCMLSAINEIPSKGCVFFDKEINMCRVHDVRPYNCRIYGITPDEEFNPRYERLKEEYKTIMGATVKPQCNLVFTVDDSEVTVKNTDDWWNELAGVERFIGIPMKLVTDRMGGSYRTPHDHVLLYNMPENVLNGLAGIKMYNDSFEKIRAVSELMSHIRNFFRGKSK